MADTLNTNPIGLLADHVELIAYASVKKTAC